VKQLREIEGITPQLIAELDETCEMIGSGRARLRSGDRKKELNKLSGYLRRLSREMMNLTSDSYIDLRKQAESESPTNALIAPDTAGLQPGSYEFSRNIHRCHQVVSEFNGLVTRTIANLRPGKGNKPIEKARLLAELTALRFHLHDILPTKYDDGPYMKVLELLFAEIHPKASKAGYLRHGIWAIDQIEGFNND
jgi:hypothetical protein